jgi:hypothetical protein
VYLRVTQWLIMFYLLLPTPNPSREGNQRELHFFLSPFSFLLKLYPPLPDSYRDPPGSGTSGRSLFPLSFFLSPLLIWIHVNRDLKTRCTLLFLKPLNRPDYQLLCSCRRLFSFNFYNYCFNIPKQHL